MCPVPGGGQLDSRGGVGALDLVDLGPVFEQNEGRHRTNRVLLGDVCSSVHVDLQEKGEFSPEIRGRMRLKLPSYFAESDISVLLGHRLILGSNSVLSR